MFVRISKYSVTKNGKNLNTKKIAVCHGDTKCEGILPIYCQNVNCQD